MFRLLVLMSAMAVAAGCGGGGAASEGTAEPSVSYEGAIASNDLARGEEVYNGVCMACHATGPNLAGLGLDPAHMRQQIREGSGRMPPMRENRVSNEDLEASLAYMVTIGAVTDSGTGAAPTAGDEAPADEAAPLDATDG